MDSLSINSNYIELLKQKIVERKATVVVVGLGYVGLPLAVEKAKVGFKVLGIDQNRRRARMVNNGENYILDVKNDELKELVSYGKIKAYSDFNIIPEADVVVICVPTPLTRNLQPDLSYIVDVSQRIAEHLRPGQLVTLESTTYPGTTREVLLPILARTGLKVGQDFFVSFSPERVDPGNKRFTTKNTSKIVGGITPQCLDIARTFYEQTILDVVTVSSPDVAEMTKVFENTYRAVNIALVNELALLCDRMGLDVWEVLDAAATKPFGIQVFYPGPGVGGHCIPIDPFYLTWKAREYDFHTRFIELAAEINLYMPYHVVQKIVRALNEKKMCLKGARILLLGIAYKKDIADDRESPALKVLELLVKEGSNVQYHDSYIPKIYPRSAAMPDLASIPLEEVILNNMDCVVILTDHSNVDYQWVANCCDLIVDTRNATRWINKFRARLVKL